MRREDQYWILDNLIRVVGPDVLFPGSTGFRIERGYAYADLLDTGKRILSLRSHPKQWAKTADHQLNLAKEAESAGHDESACLHFFRAAIYFGRAQWAIFEINEQKRKLHTSCVRAYQQALKYSRTVERVELEFEGAKLFAVLHRPPDMDPDARVPAVLFLPGMDMFKEEYPALTNNPFGERGMVALSLDGPGQGETRVQGLPVGQGNYERAISRALDYLESLDYVDSERLGIFGVSMGSYWAPKGASMDSRIRACAGTMGCYLNKNMIFNLAQPTFRHNYMFMADITNDGEFDRMASEMTLEPVASEISCPTLIATGELDELCPLEDAERFYALLTCPKEMWIYESEFHPMGGAAADLLPAVCDWMRDALAGTFDDGRDVVRVH